MDKENVCDIRSVQQLVADWMGKLTTTRNYTRWRERKRVKLAFLKCFTLPPSRRVFLTNTSSLHACRYTRENDGKITTLVDADVLRGWKRANEKGFCLLSEKLTQTTAGAPVGLSLFSYESDLCVWKTWVFRVFLIITCTLSRSPCITRAVNKKRT